MTHYPPPGGIAVSGVVYDSVRDKLAPGFEDLGPQQVKNIAEPVRAYRVVLDPEAAGTREAPRVAIATRVHEAERVRAILGGIQRQGTWRVAKKLRVVAVMGGIDLDFREAEFGSGVTEVEVTAVMGGSPSSCHLISRCSAPATAFWASSREWTAGPANGIRMRRCCASPGSRSWAPWKSPPGRWARR